MWPAARPVESKGIYFVCVCVGAFMYFQSIEQNGREADTSVKKPFIDSF